MKNRTVKLAALCLTAMVAVGGANAVAQAKGETAALSAYKSVAGATVALDSISKDRAAEQKINAFLEKLGETAPSDKEAAQAVKTSKPQTAERQKKDETAEVKKEDAEEQKEDTQEQSEEKTDSEQKEELKSTNVYITAGASNVLAYPQTDSPIVAVLPAGESYVLAGEETDYYLVQFGNVIGYVPKADAELRETVASEVSEDFIQAVEQAQVESDEMIAERVAAAEKAAEEAAAAEKAAAEAAAAEAAAAEKAAAEAAAAEKAAAEAAAAQAAADAAAATPAVEQQNTQAVVEANQTQPSTTQEAPVVPKAEETKPSAPASSKGAAVAAAALGQLGVAQDCTMLVTNSLRAVGINFHGWPADYFSLGSVVSASEAQPGDLIYYDNAGAGVPHIAVYTGNGRSVHGGWLGSNTVEFSANLGTGPVFIRLR